MNAKKLNVEIKPSKKKDKKIDVFKNGDYLFSIGDNHYLDYPSYLQVDPLLAEKRKKLYLKRHKKDMGMPGTNGFYASKLLWT